MKLLFTIILLININTFASEELPTKEEVGKLYVATFNRAPDYEGLAYWIEKSNLKLSEIARSFFVQTETQELYPQSTTNKEFIKSVYKNLFNRDPDKKGSDYWEKELNEGKYSRNKFILTVINGAQNSKDGLDKTILENKNKVGLYFANLNLTDRDDAKLVLKDVSSSESSVDASINMINNLVNENGDDMNIDLIKYKIPEKLLSGISTEFHYNYELLTFHINSNNTFTFNNLYKNNTYFKNGYVIHDYIKRVDANQFDAYRGKEVYNPLAIKENFNINYNINISNDSFKTTQYSNNSIVNVETEYRYKTIGDTSHYELGQNEMGQRVYSDCTLTEKRDSISFYDLELYDKNGNILRKLGESLSSGDKIDYPNFKYNDIIVSRCTTHTDNNLDVIVYSYSAKGFGTVINNTYFTNSIPNYSLYIINPKTVKIK